MKLVVGLGNPGKKYEKTRHNVGFMVIDKIVGELMVSPHAEKKLDSLIFYHHKSNTIFGRPQAFMNNSGIAVKKLVDFYKISTSDLWVVHDDLDLRLGEYKIQKGKGPREHKGVLSIEKRLEKKDFWRVRVGVDNREEDNRISGEDYVLMNFSDDEGVKIKLVIDKAAKELVSQLINGNYT
jgi:PTH1 family peptidyl-tRNA hydrolase